MDYVLILELIGIVSFAVSGAMVGLRKGMDFFGVVILGIVTSVGGGCTRDVILGIHPPLPFQKTVYGVVALIVSAIIFFPYPRMVLKSHEKFFNQAMFTMDTLGLGVFTVVGVQVAYDYVTDPNYATVLFVGVISGVGGSVLRDVLCNEPPAIFMQDFYACASLLGAVVCVALRNGLGHPWDMVIGAIVVIVLRILAHKFHWGLPQIRE